MSNKSDAQILEEHDIDPANWILIAQTLNKWGNDTDPEQQYSQEKLHVVKKRPLEELVIPARTAGHKFKAPTAKRYSREPKLVVFVGDQHAPFEDKKLHKLFLSWLDQFQPDEIILMGDGGDYSVISRHQNRPEWAATTQSSIDGQYAIYRDIREHAPGAKIKCLVGNHEIRLASVLLNDVQDMYGISKAVDKPTQRHEAVLGLHNLLRLDELQIDLVEDETHSTYDNARIVITPELIARHGTKATTGAGKSAWKTLDGLDHSLVQGHSHRQAIVSKTLHGAAGPKTHYGVETGCMCQLELAHGYSTDENWQQGFASALVWPDHTFNLELAKYANGSLIYRGERYKA